MDANAVKNTTVVIKGTKITATHKDNKDKQHVVTSTITKLDASKTPACSSLNASPWRREFGGVREQIRQNLADSA